MVKVYIRGQKNPIYVTDNMMAKGWYGGQWVKYVGKNTVDFATASTFVGFMIIGHKLEDAPPASQSTQGIYVPYQHENEAVNALGQAIAMCDSGLADFSSQVFDALQVYTYNQVLYLNNNGFITNIDTGNPAIGIVSAIPQDNNGWLGVNFSINYI